MIARLAVGAGAFALLLFCAAVATLYFYQRSLIYPVPEIDRTIPEGFAPITYTTQDGLDLQAGYRPARDGKPTLLFFHGNGVDWQTTYFTTKLLAAHGYGVLAAEYRGYGGNPGEPTEQGLYLDGQAAMGWLSARGIAPGNIVLVGNSLGSGVATDLAARVQPMALVLVSPFKSMVDTAANSYPWVPVGTLLHDRFENVAKIGRVTAPVLIVHGVDDQLIPLAQVEDLAAANGHARLVPVPGFGHNMSGEEESQIPQLDFLEGLAG